MSLKINLIILFVLVIPSPVLSETRVVPLIYDAGIIQSETYTVLYDVDFNELQYFSIEDVIEAAYPFMEVRTNGKGVYYPEGGVFLQPRPSSYDVTSIVLGKKDLNSVSIDSRITLNDDGVRIYGTIENINIEPCEVILILRFTNKRTDIAGRSEYGSIESQGRRIVDISDKKYGMAGKIVSLETTGIIEIQEDDILIKYEDSLQSGDIRQFYLEMKAFYLPPDIKNRWNFDKELYPYIYVDRGTLFSELLANPESYSVTKKEANFLVEDCQDVDSVVKRIYNFVANEIEYEYNKNPLKPSYYPDTTLKKRKGVCIDKTLLTIAMLRSVDVPARLVVGGETETLLEKSGHAWLEAFIPGRGWVSVDPTLKLPIGEREPRLKIYYKEKAPPVFKDPDIIYLYTQRTEGSDLLFLLFLSTVAIIVLSIFLIRSFDKLRK